MLMKKNETTSIKVILATFNGLKRAKMLTVSFCWSLAADSPKSEMSGRVLLLILAPYFSIPHSRYQGVHAIVTNAPIQGQTLRKQAPTKMGEIISYQNVSN